MFKESYALLIWNEKESEWRIIYVDDLFIYDDDLE